MASTFTTLLRLNKPALGDAGWGTAVNGGFTDLADSAIAGTTSVDVTLANVTLTSLNGAADQARQMFLVATGTPGVAREVIVPATSKLYFAKNESDDVVTFKVSGQTGVAVPVNASMALRVDTLLIGGADIVVAQDQFVDLTASGDVTVTGTTTLAALNASDLTASGNVTVTGTTTLAALNASGNVSFDGGTFVFNESGADRDARFEGDGDPNLLFLDASTDRVGVGTDTPAAILHVKSGNGVILSETTQARGSNNNYVSFRDPSGEAGYVGYGANNSSFYIWNALSGDAIFGTDATERARITSGGSFGVNGTPPGDSQFFVQNSSGLSFAGTFANTNATGYGISIGTDSGILAYFYPNGTRAGGPVGGITTNGSTTSFNQSSDRRLKENIAPAADAGAVIDGIEVVQHDWKVGGHTRFGVIAQDLNVVAPEAVTPGDNNEKVERPWGVDYSKLVPMLIKEVQSLRARVAALEAK